RAAALANGPVQAVGERADEIHQVHLLGGGLDLKSRDRAVSEPDLVFDAAGEQVRILRRSTVLLRSSAACGAFNSSKRRGRRRAARSSGCWPRRRMHSSGPPDTSGKATRRASPHVPLVPCSLPPSLHSASRNPTN